RGEGGGYRNRRRPGRGPAVQARQDHPENSRGENGRGTEEGDRQAGGRIPPQAVRRAESLIVFRERGLRRRSFSFAPVAYKPPPALAYYGRTTKKGGQDASVGSVTGDYRGTQLAAGGIVSMGSGFGHLRGRRDA